jgi:nitrous oxidase accessory protein NosD
MSSIFLYYSISEVTFTPTQYTVTSSTVSQGTYTVSVSGSNYVVNNQKDFATMMNNLNNILKFGDIILIKNGVYIITKTVLCTKDGITYRGESVDGTILRASSSCTNTPFALASSSKETTVEHITFDANLNPYFGSFLEISGQYNIIQNCRFINAMQYCLVMCSAHDFKVLNNYFETSEYGISTGSNSGHEFASNGEIAYNTIRDTWACGIKLKFVRDTWVHDNDIDTAYITSWNANGNTGIRYYQLDGPTVNVRVENNHIYDSKKNRETYGIVVDQDLHLDAPTMKIPSSGQVINNNLIENVYHGIWIGSDGVTVTNNTIVGSRGPSIENYGSGTILSGNVIK